ncbi:MAG: T9SS type A sorting domain-containing protein, partial [Candidatus Bathyarchaeota archaeon]|nr:T9SS type A sorting domain-containing protein [Candidatus Bathyarchaeota archaeon]
DKWGRQGNAFEVRKNLLVYPNPCYPGRGQVVTIANLSLSSEVRIYIYDLGGNLVRTLGESETTVEGASKTALWDCRNDNGELVARGIYIYFVASATGKRTGKIALIK